MTALAPEPLQVSDTHDNSNGNGHHGTGPQPDDDPPPYMTAKRNSAWPFLMDLGWVLVLVGWIIFKSGPLMVVGAAVAMVALINWIREARADFAKLSD